MMPERRGSELHATAASRLRAIGQRATANRLTLVEVLAGTDRPLTTSEILARRRGLPQSSVYRSLLVLEQAGVVRRVAGTDEFSRYELAEDLIGHHHHLVCSSCGAVEDFEASSVLERAMSRAVQEVAEQSGWDARSHHVQLRGLCRACS
jgi:Fur family ferric uptake transcriptional regulator